MFLVKIVLKIAETEFQRFCCPDNCSVMFGKHQYVDLHSMGGLGNPNRFPSLTCVKIELVDLSGILLVNKNQSNIYPVRILFK